MRAAFYLPENTKHASHFSNLKLRCTLQVYLVEYGGDSLCAMILVGIVTQMFSPTSIFDCKASRPN